MRTNHADGSRQAQTVLNRRQRVRKAQILAVLLTPLLVPTAAAGSDRDSLSLSPLAVPPSTKPLSAKPTPPSQQSFHDLGEASYPRTHYQKALYLRQKGELDAALIEFLKATQVNPHLVRAFYEQALIFRERHYLKLAESALEQALAVKPDYQPARILLATVRLEQGNLTGAVSELSRTLGLAPAKGGQSAGSPAHSGNLHYVPLPGESMPDSRAPALMQTPHTLLPEPPAPPPVSPPAPSFEPAPAQFQEVPAESRSRQEDRDRRTGIGHEPFQLEGSPIGPPGPPRPVAQNNAGSTVGTGGASPPQQHKAGFWQRALSGSGARSHSATASTGRLPFAGSPPAFDFKFPNLFGFFKTKETRPQHDRTSGSPPAGGADISALPAPAQPAPKQSLPSVAEPPPPPVLQSIQPAQPLPPSPPAAASKPLAAPPAQQPASAPAAVKSSSVQRQAKKSSPGWLEKVLAGVRDLSTAALAPPGTNKPRLEKAGGVEPAKPPRADQNVESIPMVVFAERPTPGNRRAAEDSVNPITMVIRQPPQSDPDTAGEPESPPRPVPVAMARSRLPLPSPRGPAEQTIGQTLPAKTPPAAQSSTGAAVEPAPLPDRPVVAAFTPPVVNFAPAVPQAVQPTAPALPAARNRSVQPPAQPATMPRNPSAPVPQAPARSGMLNGFIPSWISPSPLAFPGGDSTPTPRQIDHQQARQPVVQPNRIQEQRAPFLPVRAVVKAADANPLAFLFGSEPGPKPTPPRQAQVQQAPQPSGATPLPQVTTPPLVYKSSQVAPVAAPQAGESPRAVQRPVQPLAILQRAAVQAPLPAATHAVIQKPVQPSITTSSGPADVPQPPKTALRSGIQPPVPQVITAPTALAFAGDQTGPVPRQVQQQQPQASVQSINPLRLDTPRLRLVQISAVGRAPEPVATAPTAAPAGAPPVLPAAQSPLPATKRPASSQMPAAQQVPAQDPQATPGTPIRSTLGYSSLPGSQSRLLAMAGARLPAAYLSTRAAAQAAAPSPPAPPRVEPLDPIGKRLKYLAEHGTASLKEGEAFMFSEETGEAILFQSHGETLRRKIAEPQDGQQVVRNRRPDLAFPQELKYNLSLLAKLLPHLEEPKPQTPPASPPTATFTLNELMSKPEGMFGWLRQFFHM